MNKMDKLKKYLFKNKLSLGDERMVNFFSVMALSWLPPIVAFNFFTNWWDFIVFGIADAFVTALLYIYIRRKMASKPQNQPVLLVKIITISIMVLNNFFMAYIYSYKVFESKNSLWATVSLSLFLAIYCVEAWIHKSNEKEEALPVINS